MATEKNPKRLLTEKQMAFVDEYLLSFNAVQAYIKAGYSDKGKKATVHKNAYKLLHSEAIEAEIKERLDEIRDTGDALKLKLEKFFIKHIEDTEIAPKDRLKAAELLAKMLGAFENTVKVDGDGLNFNFNISPATQEEEEDEE